MAIIMLLFSTFISAKISNSAIFFTHKELYKAIFKGFFTPLKSKDFLNSHSMLIP